MGEVALHVQKRSLASSDRLVVDGTHIKAWGSHKSLCGKDEPEPPAKSFGRVRREGLQLRRLCSEAHLWPSFQRHGCTQV